MDNEHGSPNPLMVMWCQFAAIMVTAASLFLYSVYGQAIAPSMGRWIMVAPPVVFLISQENKVLELRLRRGAIRHRPKQQAATWLLAFAKMTGF